ncbi:MAG: glycosyltransferase family 4 protein [Candidatus Omnitrophota bacterium]
MEKVRVLHIITNLALGGAQKNALYTLDNLDSNKYEKYFISAPWGGLFEDIEQYKGINFYFLNCLKRRIAPLNDLFVFFALRRYMRKHKISIVHTHSSKAGIIGRWAAKFAKVPIIIHTVHGWSFHEHMSKPLKALYVFLEQRAAKITSRFIIVSSSDKQKGLAHQIGTAQQYELIRYGIEISKFYKPDSSVEKKAKQVVGMIACLKPQKNPLDFIKAAAIISKTNKAVEFMCVGDGCLRPKIEREIKRNALSSQLSLLGWRKDIPDLIAAMDIVVLCSLWEGLPIALLEAMAAAKPIVAYDSDGIREAVLNNKNGYLVEPGDVQGLAKKIQELLDDQLLAKTMGQTGHNLLKESEFNARQMMRKIEALYAKLLRLNQDN